MESVEDVIRALEAAFGGVPRGKVTLHEAELMDRYSSTEAQRRAARDRDPEDDWRDVPGASIQACPTALSFLDPIGWRFYLPAYIRYGLRHLTEATSSQIDDAIYSLDPAGIRQSDRYTLERFQTLNSAQVQAIRSFLVFATRNAEWCDDGAAKEALEDYWAEKVGV